MDHPMLVANGVSKSFGDVQALANVSLSIGQGEIVGLVGSNGAGKTTLLRLLAGVYRPSEGTLALGDGTDVAKGRRRLGVVPESTGLYSRLTAWENIRYHARLHGVPDDVAWTRTQHYARLLDMLPHLGRHTKGFSRGMRQKTALLRALAHHPSMLLLDEPTAGLDVTSARTVKQLVRSLGDEGKTVIYSTHQLAEAEQVCTRIIIIHNGEVRADGTPQQLLQFTETTNLEEAYVALSSDRARSVDQSEKALSGWSRRWRGLFTPRTPLSPGVSEDE